MQNYELWSEIPYAGENKPPMNPEEPLAGTWYLNYFYRTSEGFIDLQGEKLQLIRDPNYIDWEEQLEYVLDTLDNITNRQIMIAKYWGTGVPTKQWTPIIDRLIDTYNVTAPRAGRILFEVHSAINDAFVITWCLKFVLNVARPNQLDQDLATYLCTPRHPTYPSGHAVVAGCAETVLSYLFPGEAARLHQLAEECAASRLFAGVHFPIDNQQGLRLGRQIGQSVISILSTQLDGCCEPIDRPYRMNKHADLLPPPYRQAIPYDFDTSCSSLVIPTYSCLCH